MLIVIVWLGCAALSYVIGNSKGRGTEGALLGLLLGIIGVIIISCLSPKPGFQQPLRRTVAYHPPPTYVPSGQWAPDPYRRHELRWWNGVTWSDQVSDSGVHTVDPLGAVPPPPTGAASTGWWSGPAGPAPAPTMEWTRFDLTTWKRTDQQLVGKLLNEEGLEWAWDNSGMLQVADHDGIAQALIEGMNEAGAG
jgi:hypothetical protein